MNAIRKFVGFFILIFIALPILFGIIWAVGLMQACVSPGVISELPKNIVRTLPIIVNDAVNAADNPDAAFSENTRAWLRAIKQSGIPPQEVLEKAGFTRWVENDLTRSLNQFREALKGGRDLELVTLDFRLLKQAFRSEAVGQFFTAVVAKLPACGPDDAERWRKVLAWERHLSWDRLPACRPDPALAQSALQQMRQSIDDEMPDDVRLFESRDFFPRHVNLLEMAVGFFYVLFLIPAGFILIGTLIAARDRREFFRTSGFFTMLGGLLAMGSVYITHHFSDWVVGGFPAHFWEKITWAEEAVHQRLGTHIQEWIRPIFMPVKDVAEVVAIVGLLIFAISFLVASSRRQQAYPPAAAPTPPAPPPQA